MQSTDSTGAALAVPGRAPVVANASVRLRPLTWREQLGLALAFPVIFTLWVALPFAAWGTWTTFVFGAAAGLVPGAVVYRGRHLLRRARRRLDEPEAALVIFERLSTGLLRGAAVRCDAAAHAALIRLERGELEAALAALARPLRDGHASVRARTPSVGYFGETVRSVVGWLFPEAELEVVASQVLRPTPESGAQMAYEGVENMIAALRVLEAAGRQSPPALHRAWTELDADALALRHPLLTTLVLGVVARSEPEVRAELERRIDALAGPALDVMLRRFPELTRERGDAYRLPAVASSTVLEQVAPAALREVQATPGLARWFPIAWRGGPWTAFFSLWILLAAISAGDWLLGAVAVAVALTTVGSLLHRRDRVRPLVAAGIVGSARTRELSFMAARSAPRTLGAAVPHPFDRGELMLIIALARAEAALLESDVERAREWVGWWFQGMDRSVLGAIDFHATAASALRLATLLGYGDAALRLYRGLTFGANPVGPARSGHGNAPRALGLARALYLADGGSFTAAAAALDSAASGRSVALDAFERGLYGALVGRLAARGHVIPDRLADLNAEAPSPAWVACVWPDDPWDVPGTPALPPGAK